MKRYLVFSYSDYYPCGGMSDFIMDFDTIEEILPWIEDQIEKNKKGVSYLPISSDNIDLFDQQKRKYINSELESKIRASYGSFYF